MDFRNFAMAAFFLAAGKHHLVHSGYDCRHGLWVAAMRFNRCRSCQSGRMLAVSWTKFPFHYMKSSMPLQMDFLWLCIDF